MKLYKSYIFLLMLVMSVFLSGCSFSKSFSERAYEFSAKFEVEGCEVKSSTYSCNIIPYSENMKISFNPPLPLSQNGALDTDDLLQGTNKEKVEPKWTCREKLLKDIEKAQIRLHTACETKVGNWPTKVGMPSK